MTSQNSFAHHIQKGQSSRALYGTHLGISESIDILALAICLKKTGAAVLSRLPTYLGEI